MCGKPDNVKKDWGTFHTRLDLDPPTPIGRFLGCEHEATQRVRQGKMAQCVECNTSGFLDQRCDVFQERFPYPKEDLGKGRVATPFLEESSRTITQCEGR
eukprot:2991388-Alexandrium_andersonii.AAC.1